MFFETLSVVYSSLSVKNCLTTSLMHISSVVDVTATAVALAFQLLFAPALSSTN